MIVKPALRVFDMRPELARGGAAEPFGIPLCPADDPIWIRVLDRRLPCFERVRFARLLRIGLPELLEALFDAVGLLGLGTISIFWSSLSRTSWFSIR